MRRKWYYHQMRISISSVPLCYEYSFFLRLIFLSGKDSNSFNIANKALHAFLFGGLEMKKKNIWLLNVKSQLYLKQSKYSENPWCLAFKSRLPSLKHFLPPRWLMQLSIFTTIIFLLLINSAYSWLEYTFQKEGNPNEFSTSTLASENDISRWWEKTKKEKVNPLATLFCVCNLWWFIYLFSIVACLSICPYINVWMYMEGKDPRASFV